MKLFLLILLMISQIDCRKKQIRIMRGLRYANTQKIISKDRQLRSENKGKPILDEVRESSEDQEHLFRNVVSKINKDQQNISELARLNTEIIPSITSLAEGVINQITELSSSLDFAIRKASI